MNTSDTSAGHIAVAAVLILFVLAYLATGLLTLDPASRNVPLLAGSVTLGLLVIELYRAWSDRRRPPGRDQASAPAGDERLVLLSVVGLVAAIGLIGLLAALPLYMAGAIICIGRRPVRTGVTIALLTTLAVYLVFGWLLAYRLFPGVLFS